MARKKGGGGGGAPEWLVTFADLMSLLVCFFVLIISFSNQDEKKLEIVAGSMREAFGSQTVIKGAGLVELDGLPNNPNFRQRVNEPMVNNANKATDSEELMEKPGPETESRAITEDPDREARFMMAAASIRQALQDMPDIAEISKNIIMHIDERGLNIELVDQDGRAMFSSGSKYPYPFAREVIERITPVLRGLPNRITISGHATKGPTYAGEYSNWELSADRAEVVRQIMAETGLREDRIASIIGKADTEPLFINDPSLSANRRVTILLMDELPPIPPDQTF